MEVRDHGGTQLQPVRRGDHLCTHGMALPCDAQAMAYHAEPGGPENIMLPNGQLVRGRWAAPGEAGDGIGYRPHWASCRGKER